MNLKNNNINRNINHHLVNNANDKILQCPRNNTQETRCQSNTTNYNRCHYSNRNNQTNNQKNAETKNKGQHRCQDVQEIKDQN